jgi:hypothetical protein
MNPQIVRHGEVILKPVGELPKGATLVKESKEYIVAHSETGHHHVLTTDLSAFRVYTLKGDTYIEVTEMSELLHEKTGIEVHTPHKIVPAIYKIQIKKAYDYFSKRMSQVRD